MTLLIILMRCDFTTPIHHCPLVQNLQNLKMQSEFKERGDGSYYFIKNPIWDYENEFRIVVKFKSPQEKYERVALDFNMSAKEKGISI